MLNWKGPIFEIALELTGFICKPNGSTFIFCLFRCHWMVLEKKEPFSIHSFHFPHLNALFTSWSCVKSPEQPRINMQLYFISNISPIFFISININLIWAIVLFVAPSVYNSNEGGVGMRWKIFGMSILSEPKEWANLFLAEREGKNQKHCVSRIPWHEDTYIEKGPKINRRAENRMPLWMKIRVKEQIYFDELEVANGEKRI